jgi:hypothetical protein
MLLIDDILFSPVSGIISLAKVLHERAYAELYDPSKIKEELMALQLRFELDEISEEEYDLQEARLLDRLENSREA